MQVAQPTGQRWSRRDFLAAFSTLPLAAAPRKGTNFLSEVVKYTDPTTEFVVTRLTDPSHTSVLPNHYCRFLSRKRDFLIYSSDRTGSLQAYRLDFKNGHNRLLTEATKLRPASLNLLPDEKHFVYFDGTTLVETGVGNTRSRPLYKVPDGFRPGAGLCLSTDGKVAVFVETSEAQWRIRLLVLKRGKADTVHEASVKLSDPMPRPGRRTMVFRQGRELREIGFNGKGERRLNTAPGVTGPALWSDDGGSLLYLNFPAARSKLNNLREYYTETRQDRLVAQTTQFVNFGPNATGRVFVGVSGGRATPYIILLLRTGGRELTLCEHGATDPARVSPVFSPDSRRIFFQSNRDGKQALYSMRVDDLVESTDS